MLDRYELRPLQKNPLAGYGVWDSSADAWLTDDLGRRREFSDFVDARAFAISFNHHPITREHLKALAERDQLRAINSELLAALKIAVPLLVRLGDFIANEQGRCEAIGAAVDAIEKAGDGVTIGYPAIAKAKGDVP